jgi:tRNA-modifying protein YgfZ
MNLDPQFLAQYRALTEGVGVCELTGRTILQVTGSDRTQILQSFTTNDVRKLTPGRGCEAFVTNSQGKTLGHVLIFCEAGQYTLDSTGGQAPTLISHFERYVITEDVQFTDRSSEFRDLLVAGPRSADLLSHACSVPAPVELLSHVTATLAGRPVILRRVEYAGPQSFFVQVAIADTAETVQALIGAGAMLCEPAALESARLEAGVPLFGIDITADNLPQEAARNEWAISFTKGCYLGQETVARIDAIGHVNRVLVGLKFASGEVPLAGTSLLASGQQAGHVTSAAWSPRLAAPLALAYLRTAQAKKGSLLSSSVGAAEVIKLALS